MRTVAPVVAGLGLAALAAGCAGDERQPSVLADGSPARPPPAALEGVERAVLTRARLVRPDRLPHGSRLERCLETRRGRVVERVSVLGTSVTALEPRRRQAYGCDAAGDAAAWCGRAYARLRGGRLLDPRLSVTCRGAGGAPLAFAWIQPAATAAYVVVAHDGYDEVYPVVADVPVRVATDDVDQGDASAELAIAEHTRQGRRLRDYVLKARVSG